MTVITILNHIALIAIDETNEKEHIGAKLCIENIDEMGDKHTENDDLTRYSH